MGLDDYSMSIFASLPRVSAEMRAAFREVYAFELAADQIPEVLSFGSWIGGDRDGNPFVTVESTREALERARNTVLAHYIAELERISEQLSSSCKQVSVSPEFQEQHDNYSRHLGEEPARLARISSTELYRRFLSFAVIRLRHTSAGGERAYSSAADFEGDIRI